MFILTPFSAYLRVEFGVAAGVDNEAVFDSSDDDDAEEEVVDEELDALGLARTSTARLTRAMFGHHDRLVLCSDLGTLLPVKRGGIGRMAGLVGRVRGMVLWIGGRGGRMPVNVCMQASQLLPDFQ